jgi:hypothetical protein
MLMPLLFPLKAMLVAAWMVILLSKTTAQTSPVHPPPLQQAEAEIDQLFGRRDQFDMNRNTFMVLGGYTLNSIFWDEYYSPFESPSPFQYGVQFHPKGRPFMVAAFIRPLMYQDLNDYNPRKNGLNAIFNLSLKKLQVGRLSGILNPGYWGFDLQWGRRSYKFEENFFNAPPQTIHAWSKNLGIMVRLGVQRSFGPFYLDLAISSGYQGQYRESTGQGFIQKGPSQSFVIQPNINVGFRI